MGPRKYKWVCSRHVWPFLHPIDLPKKKSHNLVLFWFYFLMSTWFTCIKTTNRKLCPCLLLNFSLCLWRESLFRSNRFTQLHSFWMFCQEEQDITIFRHENGGNKRAENIPIFWLCHNTMKNHHPSDMLYIQFPLDLDSV